MLGVWGRDREKGERKRQIDRRTETEKRPPRRSDQG